jgi:hypothetical protein
VALGCLDRKAGVRFEDILAVRMWTVTFWKGCVKCGLVRAKFPRNFGRKPPTRL